MITNPKDELLRYLLRKRNILGNKRKFKNFGCYNNS